MTTDHHPSDLRLREAFAALSPDAAFTPECPAPDRLWAGARGELPPAEVVALASHLADCGACAEAWRLARDFGAPAEYPAPARAFVLWMPAAAAVLLAAGLSVYYVTRPPAGDVRPPTAAATPPPAFTIAVTRAPIIVSSRYALTLRGPDDGRSFLAELKTALEPYERGDYANAVVSLGSLRAKYTNTAEPALYLGVSYLMIGNAAAAVDPIEQARDLADPEQFSEVTWYLAAAYERTGRRNEAQRLAQAVCDRPGPRSAAACAAAAALRNER